VKRYILDTGMAGLYLDRKRGVYERAVLEVSKGHRVGIAAPILGELAFRAEDMASVPGLQVENWAV
jgi:tRNA(fMet)-specific endonuclease VapC